MADKTQQPNLMAPAFYSNIERTAKRTSEARARILLVNQDRRSLLRHRAILEKLSCQVRASSSFAMGVRCLASKPFDLILLDQGSEGFEGRQVLAHAMEVDVGLKVVVLARAYDEESCAEAMQSGALEYLVEPVSAIEIVALVETFTPTPGAAYGRLADRAKRARASRECNSIPTARPQHEAATPAP
jgi:DNA-binding NtrC family response regulator